MYRSLQLALAFVTSLLASEVILRFFRKRKTNQITKSKITRILEVMDKEMLARNARKPPEIWNQVIFFPDDTTWFDPSLPGGKPTAELLSYFENSKLCIQICLYLSSLREFTDVILQKRQEGLCIQVITDYDTLTQHNNFCVKAFIRKGIPVRAKNTGTLMHNKFIIIDDEAVVTGSLNYTKQAVSKNSENVVVTTDQRIVVKYKEEFRIIWKTCEDVDMSIFR